VDAVIRILSAVTTYYIALAAAIFVLWPTATWPQQAPCAPYEDISKALASEYGEAVMERGFRKRASWSNGGAIPLPGRGQS
jgi:hypothetical protein